MSIGVISLSTSQKREQAGPPFASGSADNGLSVDNVTGRIVLGNDVGSATDPARLLSNREILTTDAAGVPFTLSLLSVDPAIPINTTTDLNGVGIAITGTDGSNPFVNVDSGSFGSATIRVQSVDTSLASLAVLSGLASTTLFDLASGADTWRVTVDGSGSITFRATGLDNWQVNTATGFTQFGPTLVAANGATVQVTGTLTNRYLVQSQGAGTYNVDRNLDSGKHFINSAAANFQLPNMVGANNRNGFVFRCAVKNVAGITVTASAGQTILFGSLATSSGGTLNSTTVGSVVTLVWDSSNWVASSFLGVWGLT